MKHLAWLTDLHLGDVDGPADTRAIALSTIHSAKGGEWPVVFVVGLEDGLLPHLRPGRMTEGTPGEDEERRLAYVAISRTQVLLYLVYCRTRRLSTGGAPARLVTASAGATMPWSARSVRWTTTNGTRKLRTRRNGVAGSA